MNVLPGDPSELARTLFADDADALFLFDADSELILHVNPAGQRLAGVTADELVGQRIGALVRCEKNGAAPEMREALSQSRASLERACWLMIRARDVGIPVRVSITLIPSAARPIGLLRASDRLGRQDGEPGVLGIRWDVTRQREMEAQLRHVQTMDAIGQLAGGIAHDFNNLLTIMLGNLSCVLGPNVAWHESLELLRNAERAGLRAAELTQTLLAFSRRAALATVPCDLQRAVEEVVRLTRSSLPANIEIEVYAEPNLWLVQADAGQINQVLTNLTFNARDAMPGGGKITYATRNFVPDADYLSSQVQARPGEYVHLRVRDSGEGVPADLRQRIFEPFFTTKERGKGAGLGLAIAFSIVKQHNGWIVCDSVPEHGTTFDIFLPRCLPALEGAAQAGPAAVAAPTREAILIVDDEPMIRQLAHTILARAGYEVLLAEDGQAGLEVVRAHLDRIALIVLDAIMPRLTGRETLRELARFAPDIRVLFSSGYSTEQMALHEFPQVRGFLPKPYRAEQLIQKVTEILSQARRESKHS